MKASHVVLLAVSLALLAVVSPADAKDSTQHTTILFAGKAGHDVSFLFFVAPKTTITVDTTSDGKHSCQLVEDNGSLRANSSQPATSCHLSYTLPNDGKHHNFLLTLDNNEDRKLPVIVSIVK